MTEEKIDWTVDRTEFPRGPWDEEPDYFFFRHEGTPCLVVRNSVLGHLCGYAGDVLGQMSSASLPCARSW